MLDQELDHRPTSTCSSSERLRNQATVTLCHVRNNASRVIRWEMKGGQPLNGIAPLD
jgi:hypothetical protein